MIPRGGIGLMTKEQDKIQKGILGDINPEPSARAHDERPAHRGSAHDDTDLDQSTGEGSRHDRTQHSGSRSVTEGVTGGLGTETGGTRNYRSGTGATGGDIGNRPE
jgi:hypothetical protein